MKQHIQQVVKQIEIDYDVKVLYACESGSRAWGFPSKDSDYDVRFIYVHQKEWYLSIDHKRDVIEIPSRDKISIPIHELLDVSGWELTKALRLFRKSNPPLLEWLRSNIIYYQSFTTIDQMRHSAKNIFSPASCIYHYLNMAKGNFRDYLQGNEVKIKKYFYVLRPILAAKWIEKYNTIPPIKFEELVKDIINPGELKDEIATLLERKIAGEELTLEPKIDVINQYLTKEIEHLEHFTKNINIEIPDPTNMLDNLFRDTLEEVWG
ncbi:nucleotidyltransferase domain-containing protein [Ferdinandcohnia quinoae]|uniref:Nucleotidyltransferase domain-containing protein n=1 Tax=Fredinandcohnia quinoae TaxID=2918902 RepID=A0AAW5DTR0_9BACI|nr:nucleotidyltransferase domain-containing protein [Fredinandcohnia sp. SECRCQ15]MCH1624032.1 nucleotidyltransferase domain-containing protein [Fredinandcohnia sp. SECRCQ15]